MKINILKILNENHDVTIKHIATIESEHIIMYTCSIDDSDDIIVVENDEKAVVIQK